ncbi:hypothetical protein [uncultured Kordia sp.]|uniref:hypothetical protein n=1 Tax=uncultured Kordia sp. TaxID=507699 RepID=UPI00260CF742|nr:hypothetical protein [uncultured Kordia sp.]
MRKFIGIIIAMLVFSSCEKQQKEVTSFLQQGEIKLTNPRITVSNTLIDSFVTLKPEIHMEKLSVGYEENGKTPTEASTKLHTTISATKPGIYKFRAFHPDWKPSEVTSIKLYKKGHIPNKITWKTSANKKYKGQGETTLINNQKASLEFRDIEWVGFDTIAKATVSFNRKTYIKSLTISYLTDPKSWVFPPASVTLYLNDKDTINVTIPALTEKEIVKLDDIKIPIEKEISTIALKVNNVQKLPDWHAGKGLKAWLFMDEWIFN